MPMLEKRKLSPLQRAIALFGSQQALADDLGVSQSHISFWLTRAKKGVPPEYCGAIERLTQGKVTRKQLRPDIFGDRAA